LITSKVDGLQEDQKLAIAVDFAKCFLKLCVEVESISPERDSEINAVEEELPGLFPLEILE
jgi:hypothetical protein